MTGTEFPRERLARLAQIEERHFWFVGRRLLLDRLLRAHFPPGRGFVLDVGCGTTALLDVLARNGARAVGLDGLFEGLAAGRRAAPDRPLLLADATRLPFQACTVEAVTLLDVAEHVSDEALMREVARVLKPGGVVLLAVPALPFLWSHRDRAAGHLRRYTLRSLRCLLQRAPLRIRETRYYQCLLLPLVVASRLLGRGGPAFRDFEDAPGPALNVLFRAIAVAEVRLGALVRWPAGSSLFAVAEKV